MEKMKYNGEIHDHCTRQKLDLHTKFFRTTLLKNIGANVGTKLYNKLPNTIKRLDKIQEFKRGLKYFYCNTLFIQWMNTCPHRIHCYSTICYYVHFTLSFFFIAPPNRTLKIIHQYEF
jgi:hypothetical protein